MRSGRVIIIQIPVAHEHHRALHILCSVVYKERETFYYITVKSYDAIVEYKYEVTFLHGRMRGRIMKTCGWRMWLYQLTDISSMPAYRGTRGSR